MQAGLKEGEWLGLVGSGGGLGHLGIKFAKVLGLKVVAVDARDVGLELSRQCGADLVVDARKDKEEVVKEVQNATGGEGCAVSISLSEAASAAPLAFAITKMHGRMIQIAQVSSGSTTNIAILLGTLDKADMNISPKISPYRLRN